MRTTDGNVVYNSLVDMHSNSGDLGMADEIFKEMEEKDVYTWTTMMSRFAVHGGGRRAIKVFEDISFLCLMICWIQESGQMK